MRMRIEEVILLAGSHFHDAPDVKQPGRYGPLSRAHAWCTAARPSRSRRRANAVLITVFTAADVWTDIALSFYWICTEYWAWGAMLLLFVFDAAVVTLAVALFPVEHSYHIPAAAYVATCACAGAPFAALRAVLTKTDVWGAHDMSQDMQLTQAMIEGCPAIFLQIYALIWLTPARKPALLLVSVLCSLINFTHALGSDREDARVTLAQICCFYTLVLSRVVGGALAFALFANAFGLIPALLPPVVTLVGWFSLPRATAALERLRLRSCQRVLDEPFTLIVVRELWLCAVEAGTAAAALFVDTKWHVDVPATSLRNLAGLVCICVGLQLIAARGSYVCRPETAQSCVGGDPVDEAVTSPRPRQGVGTRRTTDEEVASPGATSRSTYARTSPGARRGDQGVAVQLL